MQSRCVSRDNRRCVLVVAWLLTLTLIASPLVTAMDATSVPVETPAAQPVQPAPEQSPTPTPSPTPTATPSPTPTSMPTEAPEHTPTIEPTVTATVEPVVTVEAVTPTPAPVEDVGPATPFPTEGVPALTPAAGDGSLPGTPTPGATSTPAASATPAPHVIGRQSISPMASSSSTCTQVSPRPGRDTVPVGGIVEFQCQSAPAGLGMFYDRAFVSLSPGWTYRIGTTGNWNDRAGAGSVYERGSLSPITVQLSPTDAASRTAAGTLTIRIVTYYWVVIGWWPVTETITLSATVQAAPTPTPIPEPDPTAEDLQISCSEVEEATPLGQPLRVECTYAGRESLGTRQITLNDVLVMAPAGWTISGPVGRVMDSTLLINPNAKIGATEEFSFSYTLTPTCDERNGEQALRITSLFSYGATGDLPGASFSHDVLRQAEFTLNVTGNTLSWTAPYSLTDYDLTGTMTYTVAASTCSLWEVRVSATNFTNTGTQGRDTIPAAHLMVSPGEPGVIEGDASGVEVVTPATGLNTPQTVLRAGAGAGTYEQTLDFTLRIPGKAPIGSYESTITIEAATAP